MFTKFSTENYLFGVHRVGFRGRSKVYYRALYNPDEKNGTSQLNDLTPGAQLKLKSTLFILILFFA
jgi:hypothetical protein